MVKHIVFWKLKESAHGNSKEKNAQLFKEKLEALNGKIEGLLSLEVGLNISDFETTADVALYSTLASRAALAHYIAHPEHQAVVPFVKEAVTARYAVDYET